MTPAEYSKIKRVAVIGGIIFMFLAFLALLLNVVRIGALSAREKELDAEIARQNAQIAENGGLINELDSDFHKEKEAYENGRKGKDDLIFEGK